MLLACCAVLLLARELGAADATTRGNQKLITGSGVPAEKVVPIPANARKLKLDLPGSVTVRLDPKASPRAIIRFDRNLIDLVSIASSAGSVKIDMTGSFQSSLGLRIDVVLNAMESLEANGSADVTVEQLNEPRLVIESAGSGNIRLASGRVAQLVMRLSGSGDLSAGDLAATACEVSSSGSGSTSVRCSESVTGDLSGAGDLAVAGKPKRRAVRALGAGDISFE